MMDSYCNRTFEQATYTDEAYDGSRGPRIVLPHAPVSAVTAVKIRHSSSSATTLATSEYRFHAETGILIRDAGGYAECGRVGWPFGHKNILVTYTGGYASGSVPSDVTLALYTITDRLLAMRGSDPAIVSESDGLYQYQRIAPDIINSALLPAVLGHLRRPIA